MVTLPFPHGRTIEVQAGCFGKRGELRAQLGREHATNSLTLMSLCQLQTPSPSLSPCTCTVVPLRLVGQTAQDSSFRFKKSHHISLRPGWHPRPNSAVPRNNVQCYNPCEQAVVMFLDTYEICLYLQSSADSRGHKES